MSTGGIHKRSWPAAMALGAWILAWGWAAEAHEPSCAGGAPSAIFVAAGTIGGPVGVRAQGAVLYQDAVIRRPWIRGGAPPVPAPVVVEREPQGWVTLRGGFFDTEHVSQDDWLLGFKATGRVGQLLQLGISTDWQQRSGASWSEVQTYVDPGGNPVQTVVTTYDSNSDLVPILGIVELQPARGAVRPYLGVGAGYEALIVEVRDYAAGIEYHDEYGGFGVQPYAGVGFVLAPNLQFVGEFYANFGNVDRTVVDAYTGYRIEQEIDVDGIGLRGGLSFGF